MLGLAPWRRGWRLLWRFPAVWWAFAATGVVLVLASTITPLYVSAAASASVAAQQAGRCPWAAGMQAHGRGPVELADSVEAQRARSAEHIAGQVLGRSAAVTFALDGERAHLGPALVSLQGGPLGLLPGPHHQFDQTVRLLFRQQAEQHIQVLERVPGQGFLLTKEAAANVEVKPGGSLTIRAVDGHLVRAPVVGIYTDMAKQPMTEFWCSLDHFIHQRDPLGNNVPPPLLLATDSATTIDLLRQLHPRAPVDVEAYVQRPLRPGLRMDQAEQALAAVNEGRSSVPADDQFRPAAPFVLTELPFIVRRAHALRHALLPPVAALSVGAALAALGLVAVAGSFWAERRRTELDVLSSRGVGPGAQALKAAIECAPPLLLGLLAGSALSVAVVRWLGPDGEPAPVAMNQAAGLAIGGWLLALLVLAGCVAARRRAPRPRRVGGRTGFLLLAVELVGLVVSLVALGRVSSTEVESDLSALPTFGLSRLLLPLGVLVFGSLALVRMLTMTLPSLRNRGQRWPTTVLLAVQRLAAVPRVPAALALGVAISAGTGVFAGGVAGSLQRTVDAKAQVFVGSDTAFELLGPQPIPAVGTTVFRPPDTRAEDRAVRVLAIDPTTFTSHAFWDPDFSSTSIEELVGRLGPASDGQLPAILVGGRLGDDPVVEVPMNAQTLRVPMTVVGRARGFPGMTTDPLLVVSEPALRQVNAAALRFATQSIWLRGAQQPALTQLLEGGVKIRYTTTVQTVSAAPTLDAVVQTLDILRAFGVVGAALLLMGIAIYVDVRSRRRRLAAVLTRRMGLRARTDWLSNWLELGTAAGAGLVMGAGAGVALAAYVTSLLDPVPDAPPGPLVVHPWSLVVGMVIALATATALIAALGLRRGSTVDAAVLRAE